MLLPFEMSSDLSEEAKLVDEIRNIGLKDEGRLTYAEMLMAFRRSQDRVLKMAHMNISTVNIKQMGLKLAAAIFVYRMNSNETEVKNSMFHSSSF